MGNPEALEPLLSVGYPQALIHITTGIAVRLPQRGEQIEMIPSTIRLTPEALFRLAPLDREDREEK